MAVGRAWSGSPATIGFINNYSMKVARQRWADGRYAGHLLWGALELEGHGYDVQYVSEASGRWASKVSSLSRYRLGDIEPELRILADRGPDLLFAGVSGLLSGLALARRARLFRRPIVAIEISGVGRNRGYRESIKGYDVVIANSRKVRNDIVALGRDPHTTVAGPWGPDLRHSGYDVGRYTRDGPIVSSGKTERDYPTLIAALKKVRLQARLRSPVPDEPHMNALPAWSEYDQALADMSTASIVAIPITDPWSPFGITEMNDALALAKPMVITRNPHLDCDIEAVGCGLWVEPGDVDGWAMALEALHNDPDRREAMGLAGRRWAEENWNATLFGEVAAAAVETALGRWRCPCQEEPGPAAAGCPLHRFS